MFLIFLDAFRAGETRPEIELDIGEATEFMEGWREDGEPVPEPV